MGSGIKNMDGWMKKIYTGSKMRSMDGWMKKNYTILQCEAWMYG